MLKPTVRNIVLFWLVKYFIFYVFLMFKNSNYSMLEVNKIQSSEDFFYYLWLFLFLPVVCAIIFSALLYFSFKVKRAVYNALLLLAVLIGEYVFYTWSASQSNMWNGMFNGTISMLVLMLFFNRSLLELYKPNKMKL